MNADYTINRWQTLPDVTDLNWKLSGIGDFNGDGIADLIWRHYGAGDSGIWLMNADFSINQWRSLPNFPDVNLLDLNWFIVNNGDY